MSSNIRLDEALIAPCGFYCGICPLLSQQRCRGCKQIETHCLMYECSQAQRLVCCQLCAEFPCEKMWQEDIIVLSKNWLTWMKDTLASGTGVIE